MNLRTYFALFATASFLTVSAQEGTFTAAYVADGNTDKNQYRSHVSLESISDNGCVMYASGGVSLYVTGVTMNKTAGIGTFPDREDTGTNAGLLATEGSVIDVFQCITNVHTSTAYGIAAIGQETLVKAREGKTTVSREMSSAFHSADGGRIIIDDYNIDSYAKMCSFLSTGINGQIEASKIKGQSTGIAAPIVSSKGDIHVSDSRLEAFKAPVGHVKESGIVRMENCKIARVASCGFYIAEGNGTNGQIVMNHCSMNLKDGPVFLVDNGCVSVDLEKNSISYDKDDLLFIQGGNFELTARKQKLKGDITTDSICSVALTLENGSSYTGAINNGNNKDASVKVSIEKGSVWCAKTDSHISTISFQQGVEKGVKQIKSGANVYYDAKNPANSYLEGKEYQLSGKGRLIPE